MSITASITIGAALVIFAGVSVVAVKRVNKSKANAAKDLATLEKVSKGITYAGALATTISPFLPGIANDEISTVLDVSQKGVTQAEATYKAAISTDPNAADTRKTTATSLAKSGIALEGIQDTAEIDKLIDAIIPVLVLALPKTHTDTASNAAAATSTPAAAVQA